MRKRLALILAAVIGCCGGVIAAGPDPAPAPPAPAAAAPGDPYWAVGHLRVGPVGRAACGSGTVIGPRLPDGRWHVLTARHVMKSPRGVLTLRDGTVLAVRELAGDAGSDLAVLVTDSADHAALPHALLAPADPPPGTRVWQSGWGIDRPGVRKFGVVRGGPVPVAGGPPVVADHITLDGTTAIGDSGGGFFDAATGRLVAVVSTTVQEEQQATCYAGAASAARRLLAGLR